MPSEAYAPAAQGALGARRALAATIVPMRRNSCTVVVLAGPAPGEVLAAVGRSMNVTLYRPERPANQEDDSLAAAAEALQRAGRASSPYALVPADPLATLAASWREMWDVSRQEGSAAFELEAVKALTAWRAGRFELPDYYLVLSREDTEGPDFYLGPLRSARPHRVVVVPEQEPGQQAAGVLRALGSLRHGPWWPVSSPSCTRLAWGARPTSPRPAPPLLCRRWLPRRPKYM